MSIEKRIAIEKRVVRKLVRVAKAAGWSIPYVYDGGENVKCESEKDIMDAVFSVDESWIKFRKEIDGKMIGCVAYIVLGNDGYDAICDYSALEVFEKEVMEEVNAYCDKLDLCV